MVLVQHIEANNNVIAREGDKLEELGCLQLSSLTDVVDLAAITIDIHI